MLQMTMPGDITFNSGTSYFGQNLTDYVRNGTIPQARVDDMATRILAAWYFLGQEKNYPEGEWFVDSERWFCLIRRFSQLQRLPDA